MADSFSQSSSTSIFGRLIESFKTVLIGLILFAASFVVIFWNEGRAVRTAKSLAEGAKVVLSVGVATIDPQHEGKLIHFNGTATTTQTLKDANFGISAVALKLRRKAEIYDWAESKKSDTKKNL